ncbi:APH-domain-containing protein [Eremomyces bilateralis CBS 781.70]|uniref:APH-domain-containing protein n=1 Tax=Eremomyces bilateralis CBS 781.70 TaxID=1392243 RepID=A0A6G1FVZ7_9PEZI|nr:APH-domain-containing protein [Eremomyces bilateralis CBS 781.70]KAF1810007.1 APH-domain-containing protein [Eremomyces bilateralis CBS 781.70]
MAADSANQARHDLDDVSLAKYLTTKIPGIASPVKSTKIGYGQSNPTYFVDDARGQRYILRKKPSGTIISPVAHQVDREFRVLEALGKVKDFPVPKVFCLCMDDSIIGTAFYVMEFVKGRILTDVDLTELSSSDRRKAWFSLVETLAWLHSINPDEIGLTGYGKTTGFYTRHCNTFSRIEAQQAKVRDIKTGQLLGRAHENFDEIVDYVRANVPTDRASIVHGDYKFDNVVLHPTEPRVIAILDWELSTIGHPLMDAVYVVSPYWQKISKAFEEEGWAAHGFPDPNELIDRYTQINGWDPRKDKWEVAKIFHMVRGGTISHGIQARTVTGQASSDFSHIYYTRTKEYFDNALAKVRQLKENEKGVSKL